MPAKKAPAKGAGTTAEAADPNRLVRQQAGTYRTADDRFEVRQGGTGWFLVDTQATNELGQELVRGPFTTLSAIRDALPDARRTTLKPLPRPARASAACARPKPPPPSWIDQLSRTDAAAVRRLIKALERQAVPDAEQLVRSDRGGHAPTVATRLVEQHLEKIVDSVPERDRGAARRLAQRVADLLTAEGVRPTDPLPGWALIELGPEPEPPNRRIVLKRRS